MDLNIRCIGLDQLALQAHAHRVHTMPLQAVWLGGAGNVRREVPLLISALLKRKSLLEWQLRRFCELRGVPLQRRTAKRGSQAIDSLATRRALALAVLTNTSRFGLLYGFAHEGRRGKG